MEIYKKCFENYEISNLGNCRRKMTNGNYTKVNGTIGNRGYRYFQVRRNGKRINKLFHHMVALAHIGERPEGMPHIDHIDRNKLNNNVNNLRYCTVQTNARNTHRFRTDVKEEDSKKRKDILNKIK